MEEVQLSYILDTALQNQLIEYFRVGPTILRKVDTDKLLHTSIKQSKSRNTVYRWDHVGKVRQQASPQHFYQSLVKADPLKSLLIASFEVVMKNHHFYEEIINDSNQNRRRPIKHEYNIISFSKAEDNKFWKQILKISIRTELVKDWDFPEQSIDFWPKIVKQPDTGVVVVLRKDPDLKDKFWNKRQERLEIEMRDPSKSVSAMLQETSVWPMINSLTPYQYLLPFSQLETIPKYYLARLGTDVWSFFLENVAPFITIPTRHSSEKAILAFSEDHLNYIKWCVKFAVHSNSKLDPLQEAQE